MKKLLLLIAAMAVLPFTASALQPQRGYRGFVDWSNSAKFDMGFLSIENEPGDDTEIFTGISTSHGYQFNNWLYVGGGVGFEYNLDGKHTKTSTTRTHAISYPSLPRGVSMPNGADSHLTSRRAWAPT